MHAEGQIKSVALLSVIPFLKASYEHRPHTAVGGLVIDDVAGTCQFQNVPGQAGARLRDDVLLTSVASPARRPRISVVLSLLSSFQTE